MINQDKIIYPYKPLDFYYIIIIGIYFSAMFLPAMRPGVIAAAVIGLLIIEFFRKNSLVFRNSIDILVMLYVVYNTVSFILFSLSGLPKSVFIGEYANSILPIVFYFFAKNEKKQNQNFYQVTLKAFVICFIIGFILFIQQPYFYRRYLSAMVGVGTNIALTSQYFRSLFGMTITGSLGALGVLISSHNILESKGRKGKIALLICMTAVALTFRRSALYVALLALIGIHYIGYFKYNFLKKRYLIIELIFAFLIVILINDKVPFLFEALNNRLMMLSNALNQRTGNWVEGLKYGNLIIGSGLGVFSHKALPYSNHVIADGNYIKMLAEIGIIGTLIFIIIIIGSLLKGLKYLRVNYLEIGIILALSLQAIGSNIFSFQVIAPIFWYSLGRLQQRDIK